MDYCPPVGLPEKDNELVYGKSQNLNKIRYYQETMKLVSIFSYLTKINVFMIKLNSEMFISNNSEFCVIDWMFFLESEWLFWL